MYAPRILAALAASLAIALTGACTTAPARPERWGQPEVFVPPSSFAGVHGLAVDKRGRLFAGSVVGNALWSVDRRTGAASIAVAAPEGQSDDIAIGPRGEMAWTNYLTGRLQYRESDTAPLRVLAKDLPGLNSLDFDRRNGKLYASQVFLGDAVWEIDVKGVQPPRLIARDLGGFNGFEVGPDGMLYGPLWFKGQIVKLDPATGAVTVINADFKTPAAANLDGKGNLWAIDTKTGELARIELATGRKTVVQQLKPALDNLAIAPDDGTIYVSNMADNSVQAYDPASGRLTTLTSGKLAVPAGMKIADGALWIADVFAFRRVDLASGEVGDVFRMQASDLEYPATVGVSSKWFALSSWSTGTVQIIDRRSRATIAMLHELKAPTDAIPMEDGSVLVIEAGSGELSRFGGDRFEQRATIASGLNGPVQMILSGDGGVFVTEATGKLEHVDLSDGARTRIADGLALPEGLARTPWGTLVVAESMSQRLVEIDPATGSRRTVADGLPIGLVPAPGLPPFYLPTGVAVDDRGDVYVSADRNNAVYRIRPAAAAAR
ncbi:MAG: hypothetical protein QM766_00390 [Burkholderiaceae bacterium]